MKMTAVSAEMCYKEHVLVGEDYFLFLQKVGKKGKFRSRNNGDRRCDDHLTTCCLQSLHVDSNDVTKTLTRRRAATPANTDRDSHKRPATGDDSS
jgi:hypothetical protein